MDTADRKGHFCLHEKVTGDKWPKLADSSHGDSAWAPTLGPLSFAVMCPEGVCTLFLAMVFFGVVQSSSQRNSELRQIGR